MAGSGRQGAVQRTAGYLPEGRTAGGRPSRRRNGRAGAHRGMAAAAACGPPNAQGAVAGRRAARGHSGPAARRVTPAVADPFRLIDAVYLLDTNVVSELRRARPHGAVLAWLRSADDADLHLSAVTIGELQAGVELTRAQDVTKAAEIEAWVDQVAASYNVLPMDARAFRCWARLMRGRSDQLIEDAMIAATAITHNLIVVTRNLRDFAPFDVRTLDPFIAH